MASAAPYGLQGLTLHEVIQLDKEVGRGAYGRVYAVKYRGTVCAAKEIHPILTEYAEETERKLIIESFQRECIQCSKLRHPNIVQFIGVYFSGYASKRMEMPIMVMEMMAESLTSFVQKRQEIPVYLKYSIVHDVALGLSYLHNHNPPIIHRDLSSNNVLLTAHHVAKISDLGVAKAIKTDNTKSMSQVPGTVDFMPPEALSRKPLYGCPVDVFSFAVVVLHIFSQKWPASSEQVSMDPNTGKLMPYTEVQRRQQYLCTMKEEAEVLVPLVEACLDNSPKRRPAIVVVCEQIQVAKDAYMKKCPQDIITLHQHLEQQRLDVSQQEVNELQQQNLTTEFERFEKLRKENLTRHERLNLNRDLAQVIMKLRYII